MISAIIILGFIFIIGLVIGSFLNVVILRTVSEESIVFPGSKCPKCQNPLKWYHNIPIFSYIFLKGKCAYCKEHISIQYPIVEFLTGCIFTGLFIKFCSPFDPLFGIDELAPITIRQLITFLFSVIASCLFIVIAGTDFLEMRVADKHTYGLMGTGILFGIIASFYNNDWHIILYSLEALVLGFVIMEGIRRLTSFALKVETFGDGDAYIAAGIGAYLGSLLGSYTTFGNYLSIFYIMLGMFILSAIVPVFYILPVYIKRLFNQKNWYTLGGILVFMIYTLSYWFAQESGWLENTYALVICSIVLLLLGIFLCNEILRGIKEKKSDGCPMPFGPALLIAAFIIIVLVPLN